MQQTNAVVRGRAVHDVPEGRVDASLPTPEPPAQVGKPRLASGLIQCKELPRHPLSGARPQSPLPRPKNTRESACLHLLLADVGDGEVFIGRTAIWNHCE